MVKSSSNIFLNLVVIFLFLASNNYLSNEDNFWCLCAIMGFQTLYVMSKLIQIPKNGEDLVYNYFFEKKKEEKL